MLFPGPRQKKIVRRSQINSQCVRTEIDRAQEVGQNKRRGNGGGGISRWRFAGHCDCLHYLDNLNGTL